MRLDRPRDSVDDVSKYSLFSDLLWLMSGWLQQLDSTPITKYGCHVVRALTLIVDHVGSTWEYLGFTLSTNDAVIWEQLGIWWKHDIRIIFGS